MGGKTMPFLPPMTGSGKHGTPIKMVMAGGMGFINQQKQLGGPTFNC